MLGIVRKTFVLYIDVLNHTKVIIIKGKDVKSMLRRVYGTRLVKVGTFIGSFLKRFGGEGP